MSYADQSPYDVRFEWGLTGLSALDECATLVIVDVLSFSTCVSIATERGAVVLPFGDEAAAAEDFAARADATLARRRRAGDGYSLSPASLIDVPAETRLVLPSPNGSRLSAAAPSAAAVFAGCFRNRTAVAHAVSQRRGPVGVIAAGERWADGSLRPCVEDLCGAGAIIAALDGSLSPEAIVARAAFTAISPRELEAFLLASASGRELVERGFREDVVLAAALDAAFTAPELRDGAFARTSAGSSKLALIGPE